MKLIILIYCILLEIYGRKIIKFEDAKFLDFID